MQTPNNGATMKYSHIQFLNAPCQKKNKSSRVVFVLSIQSPVNVLLSILSYFGRSKSAYRVLGPGSWVQDLGPGTQAPISVPKVDKSF